MFKITQIRKEKGLNKSQLGRMTGISLSDICKLEGGHVTPYPGWEKRIAEALDVNDPDSLFQEVNEDE